MLISEQALKKIGEFEGCKLTAYRPVKAEQYYTIGFGHYGADVKPGMTITKDQAYSLLRKDVAKFEKAVDALKLQLNQNQFEALVSFAFNCGTGNLKKLVKNRNNDQIAQAMLLYVKGADGKKLAGLVKRRQWEHDHFLSGTTTFINPFPVPKTTIRQATDDTRWLQTALNFYGQFNLKVTGVWDDATQAAVLSFQKSKGLKPDGIVGPNTKAKLGG